MPLVATRGAASAQGFGEFGAVAAPIYIEDVFSTYLYTGNSSTQTITNGIDLSGKGGLVWIKGRSGATGHRLTDTARGVTKSLESNSSAAGVTESTGLTAFNGTGFSIGADADYNTNTATYVSWTFRKQAKFFDVVTYTGNGTSQNIAHNLGSVPGCIMVKRVDDVANWCVYHRGSGLASGSAPELQRMQLNETTAVATSGTAWNSTAPTSTQFSVGNFFNTNASGGTYVAYLFAHDAGGFGLTGTDNVISCGSYTGNGASGGQLINLGYEAQWVIIKNTSSAGGWWMMDVMRGYTVNGDFGGDANLDANTSAAEVNQVLGQPDALGFRPIQDNVNQSGQTYIYIAIRRGPMKVPTSGTSVFSPIASSAASGTKLTTNFPVDLQMAAFRGFADNKRAFDRLRGVTTGSTFNNPTLLTNSTAAEANSTSTYTSGMDNTGFSMSIEYGGSSSVFWNFGRAPGFFDVVAYTGTGIARTVSHNLGVAPEMMIAKNRSALASTNEWIVYHSALGATQAVKLNEATAVDTFSGYWDNTAPATTQFTLGASYSKSGTTYIAYLFATVPGVSKVGSYTGTGTTKQIDCGFTGGARFVLIKRTDSTGDWYVWDSARGIVAGNDPYLLLNSTAAEVTSTDYVDTYSAGFEISSTAPAAINANGGTFIFLAIA